MQLSREHLLLRVARPGTRAEIKRVYELENEHAANVEAGASERPSDVMAYKLSDSFVFEAVSEKGEAFIKKNKNIFRAVMPKELQAVAKQEADAIKKMPRFEVNIGALRQKNDPALWNSVAETCLSCGACTFLCPTCHCFDLFDEKHGDEGRRIRVHDACMFEQFTKEASGHNPRAQKGDRMRQQQPFRARRRVAGRAEILQPHDIAGLFASEALQRHALEVAAVVDRDDAGAAQHRAGRVAVFVEHARP